jgi:hypothetical protein
MFFLPELYYFSDHKSSLDFKKAVTITALTISNWCKYYYADLLIHRTRVKQAIKQGALPKDETKHKAFVLDLLDWIFDNSLSKELFALYLSEKPIDPENTTVSEIKFNHPDDTCCWLLNLDSDEFQKLQQAWKENSLPTDLFYPKAEGKCALPQDKSIKSILRRILKIKRCYSPKQWEEYKEEK